MRSEVDSTDISLANISLQTELLKLVKLIFKAGAASVLIQSIVLNV